MKKSAFPRQLVIDLWILSSTPPSSLHESQELKLHQDVRTLHFDVSTFCWKSDSNTTWKICMWCLRAHVLGKSNGWWRELWGLWAHLFETQIFKHTRTHTEACRTQHTSACGHRCVTDSCNYSCSADESQKHGNAASLQVACDRFHHFLDITHKSAGIVGRSPPVLLTLIALNLRLFAPDENALMRYQLKLGAEQLSLSLIRHLLVILGSCSLKSVPRVAPNILRKVTLLQILSRCHLPSRKEANESFGASTSKV